MANLLAVLQNSMNIYQLGTWIFFFTKKKKVSSITITGSELKKKVNISIKIC